MIRLIYTSYATVPFSTTDLDALLEVSRRNNLRDEITGMLVFHDGNFLQVLEGDEEVVKSAFSRIEADNRHSGIIELDESVVAQRDFTGWSMGFKRMSSSDSPEGFIEFFSRSFDANTIVTRSSEAMEILLSFKESSR